jgi:inward rectifier potassium channel
MANVPGDSPSRKVAMRPNGSMDVRTIGLRRSVARDLYHSLRAASWPQTLGIIAVGYFASNLLFAALYVAGGGAIANARPGSFGDAFFFSVQTMATIGYGVMTPVGHYANLLVAVESLYGILLTATATGVIFAKFAAPVPRVLFSRVALIGTMDGFPTLMFRMANERSGHVIVEAQIRVTMARDEPEPHGGMRRRLFDLTLERERTPLFQLSWTAFHRIDERSPLFGATAEELARSNSAVIVTFMGIDDSLSQAVHARYAYPAPSFVFASRFADIMTHDEQGRRTIDYRRFHDVVG